MNPTQPPSPTTGTERVTLEAVQYLVRLDGVVVGRVQRGSAGERWRWVSPPLRLRSQADAPSATAAAATLLAAWEYVHGEAGRARA